MKFRARRRVALDALRVRSSGASTGVTWCGAQAMEAPSCTDRDRSMEPSGKSSQGAWALLRQIGATHGRTELIPDLRGLDSVSS